MSSSFGDRQVVNGVKSVAQIFTKAEVFWVGQKQIRKCNDLLSCGNVV